MSGAELDPGGLFLLRSSGERDSTLGQALSQYLIRGSERMEQSYSSIRWREHFEVSKVSVGHREAFVVETQISENVFLKFPEQEVLLFCLDRCQVR